MYTLYKILDGERTVMLRCYDPEEGATRTYGYTMITRTMN